MNPLTTSTAFEHDWLPLVDAKRIDAETGRTYQIDGASYPSVTSFLSQLPKPHLDKWKNRLGEEKAEKIRKYSTDRGTALHFQCEAYLRNQTLQFSNTYERLLFSKIKPALNKISRVRLLEAPLYSKSLGLAGTIDCLADFAGEGLAVIDFKGSAKPKKSQWIHHYYAQAGAYAYMVREVYGLLPRRCVILVAVEACNVPQVFVKDSRECFEILKEYATKLEKYRRKTSER